MAGRGAKRFGRIMKHRPDIDGLRAIAVLSVVFYHAGVSWLPGGFAGVDIFFVISGYLITRILLDSAVAGQFFILDFYVRRARRILPALYGVLGVTLLTGLLVMLPLELVELSESLVATTLFSSNILFWQRSGYFDTVAELKPLLHTWSLAVEEQFYVLWPLLLLLFSGRGWNLRGLLLVLLGLSFALSCWWVIERPVAAFYLLPGRSWEMLVGAWLVTLKPRVVERPRFDNALSLVGLMLVVASVLLLGKADPFPGWNALYPCLGAALLIVAGEQSVASRFLLSWRPLVWVGLISYSLYLWHWPLLVFVRVMNMGRLPVMQATYAVLLSLLMAGLSWKFVEAPFRKAGPDARPVRTLAKFGFGGLVLLCCAAFVVHLQGIPDRVPVRVIAAQDAAKDVNPARAACHLPMEPVRVADLGRCVTARAHGTESATIAIWGDSHAEAITPGVADAPGPLERQLLQMTKTSCPPLLGAEVVRGRRVYQECTDFNREAFNILRSRTDITAVVLSARWPVYALEKGFGVPEAVPGSPTYALRAGSGAQSPQASSLSVLAVSLDGTIDALVRAGKKVYLVGAIPEMQLDVPGCIARQRMSPVAVQQCGMRLKVLGPRMDAVNRTIAAAAAKQANAVALFPDRVLCDGGYCGAEGPQGEIFYYDHNHLSTVGARYVFSRLMPKE